MDEKTRASGRPKGSLNKSTIARMQAMQGTAKEPLDIRMVKKGLCFPAWIADRVETERLKYGQTFTAFVVQAVAKELKKMDKNS